MLENRGDIGGDEILAVTEAEDERGRGFGGNESAGLGLGQHDNRKRTAQLTHYCAHGVGQTRAGFELLLDQVRNEFGIGFGTELVVALEQGGAQVEVILDDAVVDDGDGAGLMRMGVALGRTAVRGPSRMADADATGDRRLIDQMAQVAELADGAPNFHAAGRGERRDTGRIVAAIFEAAEASEQNWRRFARAHITDYSAHRWSFLRLDANVA